MSSWKCCFFKNKTLTLPPYSCGFSVSLSPSYSPLAMCLFTWFWLALLSRRSFWNTLGENAVGQLSGKKISNRTLLTLTSHNKSRALQLFKPLKDEWATITPPCNTTIDWTLLGLCPSFIILLWPHGFTRQGKTSRTRKTIKMTVLPDVLVPASFDEDVLPLSITLCLTWLILLVSVKIRDEKGYWLSTVAWCPYSLK